MSMILNMKHSRASPIHIFHQLLLPKGLFSQTLFFLFFLFVNWCIPDNHRAFLLVQSLYTVIYFIIAIKRVGCGVANFSSLNFNKKKNASPQEHQIVKKLLGNFQLKDSPFFKYLNSPGHYKSTNRTSDVKPKNTSSNLFHSPLLQALHPLTQPFLRPCFFFLHPVSKMQPFPA